MADENHAERTEPASPKRLEQAREEGRVARSHELSTFAMLMAGGGGLWLLGASVIGRLRLMLHDGLTLDVRPHTTVQYASDPNGVFAQYLQLLQSAANAWHPSGAAGDVVVVVA